MSQAAAPHHGRGVAVPSASSTAGLFAGRNAGLLAGVPEALEPEAVNVAAAAAASVFLSKPALASLLACPKSAATVRPIWQELMVPWSIKQR